MLRESIGFLMLSHLILHFLTAILGLQMQFSRLYEGPKQPCIIPEPGEVIILGKTYFGSFLQHSTAKVAPLRTKAPEVPCCLYTGTSHDRCFRLRNACLKSEQVSVLGEIPSLIALIQTSEGSCEPRENAVSV